MPTTINMNIPQPTVSSSPGPGWATTLNQGTDIIDAHDHTSGKGVQIPPSGLDITSALTFQNNDATNLRSTRFYSQSTAFTDATDIGCCYVLGADLYYIDTAGNSIRITENGAISSASFGGITGLAAPATAAFSVDTFTFKSDTNEYAVMDTGDLRTRRSGETSPNYVGIQSPAALAASYQLTLPAALPAATSFATVSAAGAVATSISTSQGITKSMQAAVGQQVSTDFSGNYTSASWTAVSNATVSITTTGRPVMVFCQSLDAAVTDASIQFIAAGTTIDAEFRYSVTGSATTTVGYAQLALSGLVAATHKFPPGLLTCMYLPSAGTYTIALQVKNNVGATCPVFFESVVLCAYEL